MLTIYRMDFNYIYVAFFAQSAENLESNIVKVN